MASAARQPIGALLREWRQRRRLSQLDLACEAEISQRHLSFLESGRSRPSREMVMHLAERLEVPLRERNVLLAAAGFAPVFPERPLGDAALRAAREAVEAVLAGHEPYPALAVDRHWTLVAANRAVAPLLGGVDPALLASPANVLRLTLHPAGLAPRIANLAEWRAHLLDRLRRQVEATADPALSALLEELRGYPGAPGAGGRQPRPPDEVAAAAADVAVPFRLRMEDGAVFSFFGTVTVFGTPLDVTLSELALEALYPADAATGAALRRLAEAFAPEVVAESAWKGHAAASA
jgi:transcriptional regulator with XRE-family HTH domain